MKRSKKARFSTLLLVVLLILSACSKPAPPSATPEISAWQEQYDLGMRYLSEGKYEEAILAFTAAIEIDPKQVPAYQGAADVYLALGETDKAVELLGQGVLATESAALQTQLDTISVLTLEPTPEPTSSPTPEPTPDPTPISTLEPTPAPTSEPMPEPTPEPTPSPTSEPTPMPTLKPATTSGGISPLYFGELPIKNLTTSFESQEADENSREGFLGYTYLSFDLDTSSLYPDVANEIRACLIWSSVRGGNVISSPSRAMEQCIQATNMWGEMSWLREAHTRTSVSRMGFPTYEKDIGEEAEVFLVVVDENSSALGYCLAYITIAA